MKINKLIGLFGVLGAMILLQLTACRKDKKTYVSTPTFVDVPDHFPPMKVPEDNPFTEEGIELGRKLFYDPILSRDNSISCGTCHAPSLSFSDGKKEAVGIDGRITPRNTMPLVNLGWQEFFFWDGRAHSLEEVVFHPVREPNEMDLDWSTAEQKLKGHNEYPELFHRAFGEPGIDSVKVSKAVAQFMRTMISGNSKFDLYYKRTHGFDLTEEEFDRSFLTVEEQLGFDLFINEKGDCFHCHPLPMTQVNEFSNNGLDMVFDDPGLGGITGNASDMGRFKIPTLRNIALTAPYMHDGRFATLDEVLNFYSEGVENYSPNIDPDMKPDTNSTAPRLTDQEKMQIKAFLMTLTDSSFIQNPDLLPPD